MKQRMKAKASKIVASILVAAMAVAIIPKFTGAGTVFAAGSKNGENTCLGTSGIAAPAVPTSADSAWSGSYVYFGSYDGNPIKFRVLAPSTTAYGGSTLFLDSDKTLFTGYFDKTDPLSNTWNGSDIQGVLNGSFLNGFTSLEQGAIATSQGNGGLTYDSFLSYMYGSPVSVNDRVFLLDASEVMNPTYGYSSDCGWVDDDNDGDWSTGGWSRHVVATREKGGESAFWWLRSAISYDSTKAGEVYHDGDLGSYGVDDDYSGVAPALNINQSSIIFSSLISGNFNTAGAEYKLTIADDNLTIAVPAGQEVTASGTTITVPYQISGTDDGTATRASVLILDKAYGTSGAQILYYDALGGSFSNSGASTGTFELPSTLDISGWGTNYYVYILAEDINEAYATDYASAPVAIDAPAGAVTTNYNVTVNSGSADVPTAAAGATVTITAGTAPAGKEFDKWEVVSGTIAFAEATSSTTTFTMPAEDVEVTATYRDIPITTHTVTFNANGHGTAPAAQTIDDGNAATEPTAPMASGWTFGGWYTEAACANKFDFSTAITGDITLYAKWTEETPSTVYYTVVGGGNSTFTKGSASDLVVTVKRSEADETCFSHFTGVQIDGVSLVSGTDYTAVAGSTVITIKAETLNNLSEGGHTITVLFDDGKIETSVTAKAAGTNNNSDSNGNKAIPSTGENLAPTLFVGIAFIAVAGMLFAVILVQKKRKSVR